MAVGEQLVEGAQRGDGRAQLVRGVGDELPLGPLATLSRRHVRHDKDRGVRSTRRKSCDDEDGLDVGPHRCADRLGARFEEAGRKRPQTDLGPRIGEGVPFPGLYAEYLSGTGVGDHDRQFPIHCDNALLELLEKAPQSVALLSKRGK